MKPNFVTTILVAEDSEDDALFFERALRMNGVEHPVRFFRDGKELIDFLQDTEESSPRQKCSTAAVIFLDLNMPGTSGWEVLEWRRKHPQSFVIPTIVMSASHLHQDVDRAYQMGANAYIVKPGSFHKLVEVMKTTCQLWDAAAKLPSLPNASR